MAAHTEYETIRYTRRSHVGTLTLNRPAKLNALDPQMRTELNRLGAQLADDDTLRCLVVAGAGTSFSAGLDLAEAMTGTLAQFVDRDPDDEETIRLGLDVAGVFEFIPKLPCPSVAGESRARELILFGEIIDAAEAFRIGLANRVVTNNQFDSAVTEFADRLAAQSPMAVRGARAAIDAGWRLGPATSLRMAVAAQARCLASDEFGNALPA